MNTKTQLSIAFALTTAAFALSAGTAGCELVSTIDRSQIPESDGGIGGFGGTTGTAGSGGTTAGCTTTTCSSPADCPDPGTECVIATCDANCCGATNVADLTPTTGGQTAKDCKQVVCDGAGAEKVVNDDTDTPDAADACHIGACMNGNQAQTLASAGTSCNFDNGKVCDGNGACVECIMDAQCTSPDVCDTATNKCVPPGCIDKMQNNNETDVDCGGTDCSPCGDNLKCLVDNDCQSQVCTGGICQPPSCTDGKKNGGETGTDCGGPCVAEAKLCAFGDGCADPTDCATGACNGTTCIYKSQGDPCNNHGECGAAGTNLCADGFCCDNSCTGGCKACSAAKKGSGGDGVCGNIAIGTDPDNDCTDQGTTSCGNNGMCDGAGACQKYPVGTLCGGSCASAVFTQKSCDATNTCVDGTMTPCSGGFACNTSGTLCNAACNTDGDCTSTNYCTGSACMPKKANAQMCSGNSECTSGTCADTVCCNSACTATCQSCNLTGTEGTCTNVAPGGTDNTCAAPNVCNAGACVQCVDNTQCTAPNPACLTATHTCVQCLSGADCTAPTPACNTTTHACVACLTNGDCAENYCSPVTATCTSPLNGCTLATATDLTGGATATVNFPNGNNTYSPACIKVKLNTVVTFNGATGNAFVGHPLQGGEVSGGAVHPATSGPFVPATSTGGNKPFTMNAVGVFPYYCTAHALTGMTGVVYVVP